MHNLCIIKQHQIIFLYKNVHKWILQSVLSKNIYTFAGLWKVVFFVLNFFWSTYKFLHSLWESLNFLAAVIWEQIR